MKQRHLAVAITGASGAIYGVRLIEELLAAGIRVSLLITKAGFTVLQEELGLDWGGDADRVNGVVREHFQAVSSSLTYYEETDFFSPLASGTAAPDAMVVAPCSMGTLARIAAGLSGTLLERAADVMLKEGRSLILVPRETPLSAIHLENMLKLARLGVAIIPPMPGFYGQPQTVDELVNFVVGKVLDRLVVEHSLFKRWGISGER
jgi:4-hydroxy-3-polyprenylbenzoate decarboxylase